MSLLRRFFALSPHLRLAIIVAPAMAVLGFVLAGYSGQEEPRRPSHALQVADRSCDPLLAECLLTHDGLILRLRVYPAVGEQPGKADLHSNQPLSGATLEITGGSDGPRRLGQADGATHWKAVIPAIPRSPRQLRLAVATESALYFAELPLTKD